MSDLFFPNLLRRTQYVVKRNGHFYEYSHYKQEVREDCLGRCVYCDSHENEVGGVECMELDHFRPKKYDEYRDLVNDPRNLVWACRGCNRLKTSVWPALGLDSTIKDKEGFIDPFQDSRKDYFEIQNDGELVPLKPPAYYLVSVLALNRVTKRRLRELRLFASAFLIEVDEKIIQMETVLGDDLSEKQRVAAQDVLDWLLKIKTQMSSRLLDFRLL